MTKETKPEDVIATAKKRYQYALERSSHNRDRAKEDIRFLAASPDDPWQWEKTDLEARKGRPTLTINKLPQHVRQVTNDIRQNRPAIKFRPADSKADPEVADILMGIARHIEANSDADVAYDCAAEGQVTHGTGYIRVLNDWTSDSSFDQDIFIRAVPDSMTCLDDPDAVDPAGSDRTFFFIEDSLTEDEFKREYPDAEPIDWQFETDGGWFSEAEKKIRLAEYFELCKRSKKLILWDNGATSFEDDPIPEGVMIPTPVKSRQAEQSYVMWRKINGKEVLEEKEFPCKYIPVARAWGNHYTVDGKVYVSGLVRNSKDSQRLYNIGQSAIAERALQSPKAPWVAPVEAIAGYEKAWQTANSANHAFLPYNHQDENGNPIPNPVRTPASPIEPALIEIVRSSADDIKAETGQYDASLGAKSNETSGRAIMARQREGDTATYHYVDNLARAVRHVGRIILDMIPRIYDTRRIARILGEDGEVNNATLDPQSPQAYEEFKDGEGKLQRVFNPTLGTYDVYTTTGPSFTTRRQEAVEAMSQMTQANPELWRVIGDQLVRNMDWPGAEEMAERLKAVLLPEVRDSEDQDEIPPQVKVAMQQMQQQMQQMMVALQEASQKVKELEGDKQQAFNDQLIKAYDAETKRITALGGAMTPEVVQQLVMQTLQEVMHRPDPLEPEHEAPEPMEPMMAMPPPQMQMMPMEQEPPQGGFSSPEAGMQPGMGM